MHYYCADTKSTIISESAMGITFGLLSTIISLLGVMIGYLTLRKMSFEKSRSSSQLVACLCSCVFIHYLCKILTRRFHTEHHSVRASGENGVVIWHEHTHRIAPLSRRARHAPFESWLVEETIRRAGWGLIDHSTLSRINDESSVKTTSHFIAWNERKVINKRW